MNEKKIKWIKKNFQKYFSYSEAFVDDPIRNEIIRRGSIINFIFTLVAIYIVITAISFSFTTPKYLLSKNIKIDLQKAILIDCNLDDLRIIFDKKDRIDIRKHFKGFNGYYNRNVDLVYILEDMVFDYYTYNLNDSSYILQLKKFIVESKQKHPFDKLNESQKELFIAVSENAGESYKQIESNLVKISDELNAKNETIEQYLDKSNQSYFLSVIALLITVLQFIPQLRNKIKRFIIRLKK